MSYYSDVVLFFSDQFPSGWRQLFLGLRFKVMPINLLQFLEDS